VKQAAEERESKERSFGSLPGYSMISGDSGHRLLRTKKETQ
jgi:hypothetical protein